MSRWWNIGESAGGQTRCRDCESRLEQEFLKKNPRPEPPNNLYDSVTLPEARVAYYDTVRAWSDSYKKATKGKAKIKKGQPMFRGQGNRGGFSLCHKCAVKMAEQIYNQFGQLIDPKHADIDLMARFNFED